MSSRARSVRWNRNKSHPFTWPSPPPAPRAPPPRRRPLAPAAARAPPPPQSARPAAPGFRPPRARRDPIIVSPAPCAHEHTPTQLSLARVAMSVRNALRLELVQLRHELIIISQPPHHILPENLRNLFRLLHLASHHPPRSAERASPAGSRGLGRARRGEGTCSWMSSITSCT